MNTLVATSPHSKSKTVTSWEKYIIGRSRRENIPNPKDWLSESPFSKLPSQLHPELQSAVDSADWIADLTEDWDGQGAAGYDHRTLNRAESFLWSLADEAETLLGLAINPPEISPADEGSIDLFWRSEDGYLLINIPSGRDEPVTYYGSDTEDRIISGRSEEDGIRKELVTWLDSIS